MDTNRRRLPATGIVVQTLKSHWIFPFMSLYVLIWLLETIFQSIPGIANILRIAGDFIILLSGTFGIITALLLRIGQVQPGKFWGRSSLGAFCAGIGLIAFTVFRYLPAQVSFGLYAVLIVLSMLLLVGLAIEYRSRLKDRLNR